MRTRIALTLALAFIFSLFPAIGPTQAAELDTRSDTGVHLLTVPHAPGSGAVRQLATSVNNNDWMAVGDGVLGRYRLWKGSGYPVDICSGCDDIVITDINDSNVVVGYYKPTAADTWRGFVWSDGAGGLVDIVDLPGADPTYDVKVTGIDAAGRIAVTSTLPSLEHCDTPCSFLGEPSAGKYSFTAVPIQGKAGDIANGSVLMGGTIWNPTDGATSVVGGVGTAINESGQIAGVVVSSEGFQNAAFWNQPTDTPTILTLDADTHSYASDINESGWVVGWSSTQRLSDENTDAFLYRPGMSPEIMDLGAFTAADNPLDINPWADPRAINDQGLVVGGTAGRAVIWDLDDDFVIDYPPTVDFVAPPPVHEGEILTFTPTISDPNGPTDTFTVDYSGLPPAATWNAATGELTWQTAPGDANDYAVTMTVTSDASPANTVTENFTVTVLPPGVVLDPIGDKSVQVGQLLSFVVTSSASDPFYFVDGESEPLPDGVTIGETSGVFEWTPRLDQVGPHTIVVGVLDSASFSDDTETIVITVTEGGGPNNDPILAAIGPQVAYEGLRLVIDPTVTDPDGDPLGHQWLGDRPPNAVINGIYDFTPDETQGGEVYTVEYVATDGRGGEARETFTITVMETNQAPRLGLISSQQVFTGDTVTFDADATDPDVPAQVLTFSLEGAPAGATIDPTTGEFSWSGATTGTHTFDVVVRDDWEESGGPAPMEDRQQVTILVIDPLQLPNDVSVELSVIAGDPDADGIVDRGQEVTLRAAIAESNPDAPVGGVNVAVRLPGSATLVSSTNSACESFSINGNRVLACDVGTVSVAHNLDIVLTLDDPQVYAIEAEVTSSANPETDVTNNTDNLTLESRIRVSISELVGVSDVLEAVPPLNLQTILEAIAVGDLVDVVPPLTLNTILEAIGVTDSLDVVPPLNLATILENINVTDGGQLIYDSDGSGIPDVTATAVDPITGEPISGVVPGDEVLVTGGGLLPNSTATVVLFSEPVNLAEIVTDDDGVFAAVVTIPENTPAGEHRIVVTGDWQRGGQLEIIFPIEVLGICTIVGSDADDFLAGTSGDDVICGFGGNDIIFGGGGNDIIFGGDGRDIILGGRGDDDLFGEEGNDVVFGGRGDDYLVGGPGWDLLVGGRGKDTILQ